MAKRKKYPRLPNGYGSIRYLGKNRRNPYAVHPPSRIDESSGDTIREKPLCYVDSWIKGFAVLTAYKAGTYVPGMEKSLKIENTGSVDGLAEKILADYNRTKGIREPEKGKTFAEVYREFYEWKYHSGKTYSKSSMNATAAAFKNCSELHEKEFAALRYNDMQEVVDNCTLKHASLELIVSLFKQIYQYADIQEYTDKNYAEHVKINQKDDDEHGVPFTEEELKVLWKHKNDNVVEFILIMCYSGYRIAAYQSIDINLKERYFRGGIKTAAGKDRIVPIHSAILPLVSARMACQGHILKESPYTFRSAMYKTLNALGMNRHTPHDCRHTFSMLCEKYGVNENDRKRMMGHSFGADITNGIYGHRTLEELRVEIEKIKV